VPLVAAGHTDLGGPGRRHSHPGGPDRRGVWAYIIDGLGQQDYAKLFMGQSCGAPRCATELHAGDVNGCWCPGDPPAGLKAPGPLSHRFAQAAHPLPGFGRCAGPDVKMGAGQVGFA
jgi:hypothetical protein